MTTSNQIIITRKGLNAWVNVEFKDQDVQFELINGEDITDIRIKDIVGMAFSICPTFDKIIEHCRLNGIVMQFDCIEAQ
jgi:hypothetical protein